MEEIQVGNFIRDKEGNITEIISMINLDKGVYLYLGKDGYQYSDNCIVKHSKNIIDLIEKDDFVNGCRVYEVEEKGITVYQKVENSNIDYNWIAKDEIETILTHEQYKNNCYRIGE